MGHSRASSVPGRFEMDDWLSKLLTAREQGICLTLPECSLPGTGCALALSPHPDDPDAVAVTLRMLQQGGWDLYWAILTSGWSGVQDTLVGPDQSAKQHLREVEQSASARLFGLPTSHLFFLRLDENDRGELSPTAENRHRLFCSLEEFEPDLVLLPHGEDTNATHHLTYQWLTEWAGQARQNLVLLGNEDPKTQAFRLDLQVVFGETSATWKASLLECHRSQSLRNQATRGITFAQRILEVNRRAVGEYAERFQVVVWRRD